MLKWLMTYYPFQTFEALRTTIWDNILIWFTILVLLKRSPCYPTSENKEVGTTPPKDETGQLKNYTKRERRINVDDGNTLQEPDNMYPRATCFPLTHEKELYLLSLLYCNKLPLLDFQFKQKNPTWMSSSGHRSWVLLKVVRNTIR